MGTARPDEPPVVLFAGRESEREAYAEAIADEARRNRIDIRLHTDPDAVPAERVDYLLFAPNGPFREAKGFPNLRAVLSLWAGVDALLDRVPGDVPLVRMVEDGLTWGMIDYVMAHVLRYHCDVDRYVRGADVGDWWTSYPPLARERHVAVLGLGSIGEPVACALRAHGFRTSGWSRTSKDLPGITCRAGDEGLDRVLGEAEIVILLLPLTETTDGLMNRERLSRMREGARLINAGRGRLIEEEALLEALDDGPLAHATLDVFATEPLPDDHPFWRHDRITITPHIASATRVRTAAEAIVAQIARAEAGDGLRHIVDRDRGY